MLTQIRLHLGMMVPAVYHKFEGSTPSATITAGKSTPFLFLQSLDAMLSGWEEQISLRSVVPDSDEDILR